MADDATEILGKWQVKFMKWTWEYIFTPDGRVTWRDPLNNEHGSGRWSQTSKLINIAWTNSTAKESWHRPINPAAQTGWYSASYGSGPFKATKDLATDAPASNGELPSGTNYTQRPEYVDNVVAGEYDPNAGEFTVIHADGSRINLDITKMLQNAAIVPMGDFSIVDMYVFYQKDGKIWPKVMDPISIPNIISMAKEVRAALPGAKALRQIGLAILDLVELMLLKPGSSPGGGKTWRAKPRMAAASDAEVEAVNLIRASNPQLANLAVEECLAIRAYMGEASAGINYALRGGGGTTRTTLTLTQKLVSGLKKLPGYTGRLTRSESRAVSDAAATFVPGKPYVQEGLLSCSKPGFQAASREGNIAITVHAIGRAGKDIQALAARTASEGEVLFLPGTRFMVEQAQRVGDAFIVVLREL